VALTFAMPQGTPVLAVGDGEVVVAKRSGAAGYYVAVRHGRTYTTRYMHLRKLLVKPGQKETWRSYRALR
jgi:murein DD-endopeptidase